MAKYLTITEARKQLLGLPDKLTDEPIIITKHGKPVMVTISYEQMESLLETLEILGDKEFIIQLKEGIQQDKEGKTVSWSEARAKLGW
ncbi:MAG: type II toxin-antitoxin system Phd/YefM family antitoxin [Xenococcaceae cyanobacterium MO_207.B15]|nr:type II toxin-antitoxin system Phd/YefM family antitoxin [Xenococcaceae cyanobacterium MO_207.B15]